MLARVEPSSRSSSCDLPEESLSDHYDIITILNHGRMGKVYLAAERATGEEVALKAVCRDMRRRRDVQREYHYATHFDHPNLVAASGRLFQTDLYLVYPMEYAPYGDLGELLGSKCIEEVPTRWLTEQIASALTYMHSFQLVHGQLTPQNILIFKPNLSLVKITDFGSTCRGGTYVRRRISAAAYTPPELSSSDGTEGYYTGTSLDSWALGVLIIHCLTGTQPWKVSDVGDQEYAAFRNWQRVKSTRVPRPFKRFTVRLLRLLRRLLEPHGWSRYPAKEVFKYTEDDWLIKSRERIDSQDFSAPVVTAQHSWLQRDGTHSKQDSQPAQEAKQVDGEEQQPQQGRVSSPRRFLTELLRFTSPNSSMRQRRRNLAWQHSSSSSSSSSSFSWLNSSSSSPSFSASSNYSSV